jgi:hypothetical protein
MRLRRFDAQLFILVVENTPNSFAGRGKYVVAPVETSMLEQTASFLRLRLECPNVHIDIHSACSAT